jgi:hypothetical protein
LTIYGDFNRAFSAAELLRVRAERREVAGARRWQDEFDALRRPITPTLVLPDGRLSHGVDALARLADLPTAVPTS